MERFNIMKLTDKYNNVLPILILAVGGFIIYQDTLNLFFWHDDFLQMMIVRKYTFFDYLKASFFRHNNPLFDHIVLGTVFRPVTHYYYWFLGWFIFKTEALGYHLINLSIHISNSLLVFSITYFITRKKIGSFITSLTYLSAVIIHIPTMVSIHAVNESLSLLFLLISFWIYISYKSLRTTRWKSILIIIFYGFSLLCNERALVFPAIVMFYDFLFYIYHRINRIQIIRLTAKLSPYWVVSLLYLLIRSPYIISGITNDSSRYKMEIGMLVFQKYLWGIKWLFYEFIEPISFYKNMLFPSVSLDKYFSLSMFLAAICIGVYIIQKIRKSNNPSKIPNIFIFGLLWFIIFPLPSIFAQPFASHYFMGAIIGICILLGFMGEFILNRINSSFIRYSLLLIFVFTTLVAAKNFTRNYIKNPNETPYLTILSRQIIEQVREKNIDLSKIDTIYLIGFPHMLFSPNGKTLVSSTAFELFLGNPVLVKHIKTIQEIKTNSCLRTYPKSLKG
jgi:hypothetical protein